MTLSILFLIYVEHLQKWSPTHGTRQAEVTETHRQVGARETGLFAVLIFSNLLSTDFIEQLLFIGKLLEQLLWFYFYLDVGDRSQIK